MNVILYFDYNRKKRKSKLGERSKNIFCEWTKTIENRYVLSGKYKTADALSQQRFWCYISESQKGRVIIERR